MQLSPLALKLNIFSSQMKLYKENDKEHVDCQMTCWLFQDGSIKFDNASLNNEGKRQHNGRHRKQEHFLLVGQSMQDFNNENTATRITNTWTLRRQGKCVWNGLALWRQARWCLFFCSVDDTWTKKKRTDKTCTHVNFFSSSMSNLRYRRTVLPLQEQDVGRNRL